MTLFWRHWHHTVIRNRGKAEIFWEGRFSDILHEQKYFMWFLLLARHIHWKFFILTNFLLENKIYLLYLYPLEFNFAKIRQFASLFIAYCAARKKSCENAALKSLPVICCQQLHFFQESETYSHKMNMHWRMFLLTWNSKNHSSTFKIELDCSFTLQTFSNQLNTFRAVLVLKQHVLTLFWFMKFDATVKLTQFKYRVSKHLTTHMKIWNLAEYVINKKTTQWQLYRKEIKLIIQFSVIFVFQNLPKASKNFQK